jgi:hypothetical protein
MRSLGGEPVEPFDMSGLDVPVEVCGDIREWLDRCDSRYREAVLGGEAFDSCRELGAGTD